MTTTIKPRLPVSNISVCDGSNNKLTIVTGPCILVKATTATTVAQQVQALRPLKQIKPNEEPESLRCKRRIDFQRLGYTLPKAQPATVHRRNARERNRVKLVNLGFETLREHVPNGKVNKKLSKVETLRSAVEYIRELQNILNACDHHEPQSPVDMDTSNNNNSFDSTPMTSDVDCIIGNSGSPGTTSDASSLSSSSSSSSSGEQELNVSNVMTSSCFPTSGELSGEQMMSCDASSPCSDSSDSSYDSLSSIDDSDILKFSRWLTQLYSSAMQDSLPDFTDSQIRPDSLQMSSNVLLESN